jgi:carboxyl-terminal processing protease
MRRGSLDRYFNIFRVFRTRVDQRIEKALSLLDQSLDYTENETFTLNRGAAPWAKSKAELDEIWRKQIKHEYLSLLLRGLNSETVTQTLKMRYTRAGELINAVSVSDIAQSALNAFARSFDAHTRYIGPDVSPKLHSSGLGLILGLVDGIAVIHRTIRGGRRTRGLVSGRGDPGSG